MDLDDYITGTYDPDAPFNRPDYKCPFCFWEGDEPETISVEDDKMGSVDLEACPECGAELE